MKVESNINPAPLLIEHHVTNPEDVVVRLRENVSEITKTDPYTDTEFTMLQYDEYVIVLRNREGLRAHIEENFADWLITARTLELNEEASLVQDMKAALEILGVTE